MSEDTSSVIDGDTVSRAQSVASFVGPGTTSLTLMEAHHTVMPS